MDPDFLEYLSVTGQLEDKSDEDEGDDNEEDD